MKCTATCIFGLESVLISELKKLDFKDIHSENGRVDFESDLYGIVKANIWLRTAERVYIEMADFKAVTFDELYDNVNKLQFHRYIDERGEFTVNVSSLSSVLKSVPGCQSIIKKAIVDSMNKIYKINDFPEDGAKYPINAFIFNDRVRIYLDTSGTSLYKRGYRKAGGDAPLRETLASGLVQLSYWNRNRILMDPFCGSGTILIEAAMIARNIAPGLKREFSSMAWKIFQNDEWQKAILEAEQLKYTGEIEKMYGSDIEKELIRIAQVNARNAGVADIISFSVHDFMNVDCVAEKGIIICNPPYGERLEDKGTAERIFRDMGERFKKFEYWSKYILAPENEFEQYYGKKADKKRKLNNGKILCNLYQYFGAK